MELPSNSNSARQPSPPDEKKVVEKIVTGEVIKKKQPLGKRFIRTFFGGDAKNVAWFVLTEVIVPAAKDLVVEAGQEALHRMVHGEGRSGGRSYSSRQTSPTNYQRISTPAGAPSYRREEQRVISRRGRETHSFDEILLPSRADADDVLTEMERLMDRYGIVSVSDLYNLVGITPDYMGEKWGWTSLEGSRVARDRSGAYKLDLPPTEQLAN